MTLLRGLARRWLDLPAASGRVDRFLEWVPATDGTRLATVVFRPEGPSRSVVVVRTDARVHTPRQPAGVLARLIAEQGHTVVVQECRGLHASEGRFEPFVNEGADGAALLDWVRSEPDGDRPVAVLGFGYGAYAAWAAQARAAQPVDGLVAAFGSRDPYAWTHAGGALRLASCFELALRWDAATDDAPDGFDLERALEHRPLIEADRVASRRIDWLREWLDAPDRDAFWHAREVPLPETPPPTLLIGGWRHPALPSQLDDHAKLARAAKDRDAPPPQLRVGPWGRVRLHQSEGRQPIRLMREILRSVLRFVDGIASTAGAPRETPVQAYVGGENAWREALVWPPETVEPQRFLLAGDAATGKGELRVDLEDGPEGTDWFVYDPADAPRGDAIEAATEVPRSDVLRYATPPLAHPLELAGSPVAQLFLSSQAPSTDFVVRLYEVGMQGAVRWLCDGIARDADLDVPVEIELEPIWHRIPAGAQLRIEVTSACFPRFDRHPNTNEAPARAEHTTGTPTLQALHRGGARPSRITLPIVSA